MAYKELINVATGVKAQIDACITALDKQADAAPEIEELINQLDVAAGTCDVIIKKGEDEPDETAKTATDPGGSASGNTSAEPTAAPGDEAQPAAADQPASTK